MLSSLFDRMVQGPGLYCSPHWDINAATVVQLVILLLPDWAREHGIDCRHQHLLLYRLFNFTYRQTLTTKLSAETMP
jgi:hypothetical protein